jgi:hypothetical protein
MKNRMIIGVIIAMFLFSGIMIAQEEQQKVKAPELTVEQKWKRALVNISAIFIAGMKYAKEQGKSPADFGKFLGEFAASSWGQIATVREFVEAMHWNWQVWDEFQIETLEESENFYKARMKGMGESRLGNSGITVEEYFDCWDQAIKQITDHLGLSYEQKLEGDWVVFTVTKK